ncbi:uncharacterized protein LOC143854827 [Tasmannia lanceolata]|uniref:uncharacterized protein LOC143854827 n=1 Tax=Tasmannia lanceolata TaxID=3420 RepID=UPI00406330D2
MKKSRESHFLSILSPRTLTQSLNSDIIQQRNDRKLNCRKIGNPVPRPKVRRKERDSGELSSSARKLASGLWHLQIPEVSGKSSSDRLGSEPVVGHISPPNSKNYNSVMKLQSPLPVPHPKNVILHKRATNWDTSFSTPPDSANRFYGHLKPLEDQQITTVLVVSALQAELKQARTRIRELEREHQSSKKLKSFSRKFAEEKASWQSREHEKVRAIINDAKDALNRERKNCQRMEIVNSKLATDLAKANLSAKQLLQDYENERNGRELLEEVCDELAKEIGKDKAEIKALKRESMTIRDEVEKERKMLQMAEVCREERVQMELIDVKLALEEKHSQLSKLIEDLEDFLRRGTTSADVVETRHAELFRDVANLVRIQAIKEFSYQTTNSEENFSVFKDLHSGEANKREIEPCFRGSLASRASEINTISPEAKAHHGNTEKYTSGWGTVSHCGKQCSSYLHDCSNPSAIGFYEESNLSVSETEWEESEDNGTQNTEISEVYTVSVRQSRRKLPSISRLWRSCMPEKRKGWIERPHGIRKNSLKAKLWEAKMENQKFQLQHVLKQKI